MHADTKQLKRRYARYAAPLAAPDSLKVWARMWAAFEPNATVWLARGWLERKGQR